MRLVSEKPGRWWHLGLRDGPRDWEGRARADVAAPAPEATVQAGDGPAVPATALPVALTEAYPAQRDTVLEHLRAQADEAERREREGRAVVPASRWPAGMNGAGAEPWWFHIPVFPCSCTVIGDVPPCEHQVPYVQAAVDDRGDGRCPHVLGNAAGRWRCVVAPEVPHRVHREGDVEWTGPADGEAAEASDDEAPEAVPLPEVKAPEALPGGTLGFAVMTHPTPGGGLLATSDFTADRGAAEYLQRRAGGTLVRIVVDEP